MNRRPQDTGFADRFCDRLIGMAAALIPYPRSIAWQEEWRAELVHARRRLLARGRRPGPGLCLRCLGAIPHALWITWEERMLDTLWQDVRFAWRTLIRRPGYAAIGVATLGLGIGASTALFSVVDGVLLRPLAFPESDRLVRIYESHPEWDNVRGSVAAANFFDWRESSDVLEEMAGFQPWWRLVLQVDDRSESVVAARVFANTFQLLGMPPTLGRTFHPEEDHPDDENAIILSHGLWSSRFGADPEVVGRRVTVEGQPVTVIGVMPPDFAFPSEDVRMWFRYNLSEDAKANRKSHVMQVVARTRPGATVADAQTELTGITERLKAQFPEEMGQARVEVVSLRESLVGDVRPTLLMLLGAVLLLLLVGGVNVAGLGVARGQARGREVAIRAALGAGGARITRLLLTESALLATLAGAVGIALAHWGTPLLMSAAPADLPRAGEVAVDGRALAFALSLALLTALAIGSLPAFRLIRHRLAGTLRAGGRGIVGGEARVLNGLIVVEVALSVTLLVGAGLLLRSYENLRAVDTGFEPNGVLTARIEAPSARYSELESQQALYDRILERVRGLPGVNSAAVVTTLPIVTGASSWSFRVEGREARSTDPVRWDLVTPGYFRTMGIPLLRGRTFDARDHADAPATLVIDETTARRFFPEGDALGARVRIYDDGPAYTIVGVVGAIRSESLRTDPRTVMYSPYSQNREAWRANLSLVARTSGDPLGVLPSVTRGIREVEPGVALHRVGPLPSIIGRTIRTESFRAYLLAAFAAVALLLAAVGLYGTLAYVVARRLRELAIRSALGAGPRDLVGLVAGRGVALAVAGAALGLLLAAGGARLIRSMLFGVGVVDVRLLAALLVVLGASVAGALAAPAWRAARLDPAVVLREE